jgi:hypothetical protein
MSERYQPKHAAPKREPRRYRVELNRWLVRSSMDLDVDECMFDVYLADAADIR